MQIRQNRLLGLKAHRDDDKYIDQQSVAEEVALLAQLCARHNWPPIDVTRRSIEETAAAVLSASYRAPPSFGGINDGALACRAHRWYWRRAAPRAGALLEAAGIPIELCPADIDERALEGDARRAVASRESPLCWRARKPPRSQQRIPAGLSLAPIRLWRSARDGFPKPADRVAARAQLQALRGRTHELHAAIACVQDGAVVFEHVETARLTMRAFSDDFLDRYLDAAGAAVTASVGGYQLEGLGIQLFERIEGDYFTILGLPLLHAARLSPPAAGVLRDDDRAPCSSSA